MIRGRGVVTLGLRRLWGQSELRTGCFVYAVEGD
jgi:hypothetical protein